MKRNAFFLFAALLLVGSFHIGASRVFADAPTEDGTASAPWLIHNADELRAISEKPDDWFRLAENVELSGDWEPLCASTPFEGTLDGGGRTISGLTVGDRELVGLFAQIGEKGRVRNLKLRGTLAVGAATRAAGSVAATCDGVATGVVCRVEITVAAEASSEAAVGGLVGAGSGIVAFSEFDGTVDDARGDAGILGAIVGRSDARKDGTRSPALPRLFTAHAGFAAKGGVKDQSEDNTLENIVKALRYRPDVVEVDVRPRSDGTLVISHNAPKTDKTPTLEAALRILMGELPPELEGEEFDPEVARKTKIQLDAKKDGLFTAEFELIEKIGFPLDRVIMAGDASYETVLKNIEPIRAAVERGMEFWMNPDRMDSYDALTAKAPSFLEKIEALGLPRFTVNSYYGAITPDVEEWLRANNIQISMWTLNDATAIERGLLRGAYNVTSRLPEALTAREECARRGVYGVRYDDSRFRDVGRERE